MASSTSSYSFTDDEVTQLARSTDQAEFLYLFKRILNQKAQVFTHALYTIMAMLARLARVRH